MIMRGEHVARGQGRTGTYVLDEASHTGLRDTTATKDLDGVRSSNLRRMCAIRLEERNRPSELLRLLLIRLCTQPSISTAVFV